MSTTISTASKNQIPLKIDNGAILAVNMQPNGASTFARGELCKLHTDGTIKPIEANTDLPFGIVLTDDPYKQGGYTVMTFFAMELYCAADGAVTTGDKLSATGVTSGVSTVETATTTNPIFAIALADAADTEEVKVGVLKSVYQV